MDDDGALVRALTPTVELAIRQSVRRDPQPLADAIFPVIGPAIRRAIAAAIDGLIESMNRAAELAFSLTALRWRIEAWRTGRSFGAVVIAHRLRYSVEQIFLIQRDSGLLLAHVSRTESVAPDIVSGMLTAIQEFVRESFSLTSRESLRTLQAGELTVLLEQGPTAVLAAVIRGYAPQAAAVRLQELIESLHRDYGESLEQYDTEPTTTAGLELHLRDGLVTDLAPLRRRWRLLPITVALTLVLGAILLWGFASAASRANWNSYVRRVTSTPGLVVIESGRHDGRWFISGLRDPLAIDPQLLLDSSGVRRGAVEARWRPYLSLDPEFVLRRARIALTPPPTVTLSDGDSGVAAEGVASHDWIAQARRTSSLLGLSLDMRRLRDRDLAVVDSEARAIATMLIRFPVGSAQPTAEGARVADDLVKRLAALLGAAHRADASIDVATV
ncbi:MAG TPA: hypothetical protein VFN86_01915, partial [Casimicrobiaceae bacterium]|nr:hypothetical protein [Casimicrobiaceae bacterium]